MTEFNGSILELKGNKATVMTEECNFIMIKRQPGMFIGQQIKFQRSDISNSRNNHIKYLALIASVFVLTFSYIFYNQFLVSNNVYAFIDVDINPSIEFAIDRDAQVLNIKPLNEDAQTLLKELKLNDLPIKQAISEVVKESKRQGFIKSNKKNAVLVSAILDSAKELTVNESDVKDLDSILYDINSTTFDVGSEIIKPDILKVTSQERALAEKNKISMGRYALYNKIKEKNINISVEEAKTSRVSDMLDEAQDSDSNNVTPEKENKDNKDNKNNNNKEKSDTGANNSNENSNNNSNSNGKRNSSSTQNSSSPRSNNSNSNRNSNSNSNGNGNGNGNNDTTNNIKSNQESDKFNRENANNDNEKKILKNKNDSSKKNKPSDSSDSEAAKGNHRSADQSTTVDSSDNKNNKNSTD